MSEVGEIFKAWREFKRTKKGQRLKIAVERADECQVNKIGRYA